MSKTIKICLSLLLVISLVSTSVIRVEAKERKAIRPLFIGDSRTVGLIATTRGLTGKTKKIEGTYDGVDFIGKSSTSYNYLKDNIDRNPNAKVIISWMGINGLTWDKYKPIYDKVLKSKKTLILITLGGVDKSKYYGSVTNKGIEEFNSKLLEYADKNSIQVIDVYSYLESNGYTSWDGLHYKDDTNEGIYNYILSELNSVG